MTGKRYGATPDEWAHFDLILGLGADLLPVVSNPHAVISPKSKMKGLGKTPSIYNAHRQVAGIKAWTEHAASAEELERWASEPDYGICLQTREVRALDIDIEDHSLSGEIADFIAAYLGWLPRRMRPGSGKQLLAFRMPGGYAKRVLRIDGGIVEFLATGQQFVAIGTHPKGQKYLWELGLPDEFPTVQPADFERLWAALAERFGTAPPTEGALRRRGEDLAVFDPIVDDLDVLSWGKDGQAFITCPFESQHTMDSGETGTAYFPRGTGGYELGHFVCLHAHCAHRTDGDFLDALGLRMKDFDVIETVAAPGGAGQEETLPVPNFERNKTGDILATKGNLKLALERPDICKWDIRFDTFRDEIVRAPAGTGQWRAFRDEDYFYLCLYLESQGFKPISKEAIRDAVHGIARLHRFDTAEAWLAGVEWDGTPRVADFLKTYFGAADDDYTRSVSTYLWTALAGRVLSPGVKADMVPVLIGRQGVGKSYGVSEMVPSFDHTESINLMERDADLARRMRGKLVIEIGELRGLHSRDMETIKEFITRTYESWVPKYQEFAQKYPRRCVFIGTTNQEEFLADTTGNRRWLPVRCGAVNVAGIRADRLQLWAEARYLYELIGGIAWQAAQEQGAEVHDDHRMTDVWAEEIERWLHISDDTDGTTPATRNKLRISEILQHALHFDLRQVKRGEEMRVASILRELGYTRKKLRVSGESTKVWVKA